MNEHPRPCASFSRAQTSPAQPRKQPVPVDAPCRRSRPGEVRAEPAGKIPAQPRHATPASAASAPADTARRPMFPDTRRRISRRTPPREERWRIGAVVTVSALLTVLLFLVPALLAGDSRTGALPLSGNLTRETEAEELRQRTALPVEEPPQESAPEETRQEAAPTPIPVEGERDGARTLRVLDRNSGGVSEMSMRDYLICVLRGEMPASFEQEALKAQAVAARTYTRYMLQSGGKHGGTADICTDPACCQAYLSAESALKKWGSLPEAEEEKLRAAVVDTDGEILLYDSAPILAVFHSASAGLTRTSGDVWSGDKPYLQPVSSPEPADSIPNYYSRAEFTVAELRAKLKAAFPPADLSGPASDWLTQATRDDAGSIITISVGGVSTQGSRVRTALDLRSACFTWELQDGKMVFHVTGHGHGVGLSQYGAEQMARDGADYREILTHYYTGVTLGGYTP